MKTSFYFFLWFIVYYLIGLTGSPLLIQNGFFVALILVFFISRLDRKFFAQETQYQANLNRAYIFEIFYTNDAGKMAKIIRNKLIGQTVWAIYCILTVIGLLALRSSDIFAYVIFGLFGVASMIASSKCLSQYKTIKEDGLPPFDESQFSEDNELFVKYCELRRQYPAKALQPQAPSISKWVNIASIIFAVACIGGGLFYLSLILFKLTHINLLFSAMLIWAVLAVYFGIKDLVGSIRILQHKPIPSPK